MLPANFLRQLIRLYGDTLQGFVPGYLEASMETFSRNQEAMREQVRQAFEANPALANFEALARSNMEWFENALRMFAPFATGMAPEAGGRRRQAAAQGRRARGAQGAARRDAGAARQAGQGGLSRRSAGRRVRGRRRSSAASGSAGPATAGRRGSPAGSRCRGRAARRRRPRSRPARRRSASRSGGPPPPGTRPAPGRRGPLARRWTKAPSILTMSKRKSRKYLKPVAPAPKSSSAKAQPVARTWSMKSMVWPASCDRRVLGDLEDQPAADAAAAAGRRGEDRRATPRRPSTAATC